MEFTYMLVCVCPRQGTPLRRWGFNSSSFSIPVDYRFKLPSLKYRIMAEMVDISIAFFLKLLVVFFLAERDQF